MGAHKQMTKSILITGGLGYVGGRVAEGLSKDSDYKIFVTSRKPESADLPGWLSKDQCIRLDILNDDEIKNACKNIDIIIHFAALNEIDSANDPERALLINGLGTLKLVKSAKMAGVKRFIYFSTAHVYCSPLEGTISETTLPRPVHPYAISHRTAEDFVLAMNFQKEMQGIVLRLSNSIGAPINAQVNRWSLVGNDLCRQAITNHKMHLKTSGIQKRDFITLPDVARAVYHIIKLPDISINNGIFNLGGENPLTIYELALKIQKRCELIYGFSPSILTPKSINGEKSKPLNYSIEKLKSTGFLLEGNLDQEIDDTLRFCKKHFTE
jgi:UDP-glucose 4-epimerase